MNGSQNDSTIKKIAFIGNYLPRQCGIATFTTDLCESVASAYPQVQCFAVPITDIPEGYAYPERVRFEISENDIESYHRAADFLNIANADVVCLQHEFGIFGGPAGSYILTLLREINMPVVTTLHTVLRTPNAEQRKVMDDLLELSDRVVTMTKKAYSFLTGVYQADQSKIRLIPHGIPDVPFIDPNFYKDQFGVEGKTVLLTFGLLSPNKGIENVIHALPRIIAEYPNMVYIILGATHPNLLRQEGESYRLGLQQLARDLAVDKSVVFYNQFVTLEELKEFLVVADLYITPYCNAEQITSGTLAYSFGCGNAVISTPYWHAEELLAEGRGVLVPFGSPDAIADAVIDLMRNDVKRNAMRKNAYLTGREMIWSTVAGKFISVFEEARIKRRGTSRKRFRIQSMEASPMELPRINIRHLLALTDTTGIIQHARFTIPNYAEGYCTDDNARALILVMLLEQLGEGNPETVTQLAATYLSFLNYAFDEKTRHFRNFMSYDRKWTIEEKSEDAHGQTVWALGTCIGHTGNVGFRTFAGQLFEQALGSTLEFSSPRAWAFTIIGIQEYLRRFDGDRFAYSTREQLAEKLIVLFRSNSSPDWPWFENTATYCNAKLSHVLIMCGRWMNRQDMLDAGLRSLEWLLSVQTTSRGHFRPIGTEGFYPRGGTPAAYNQQPIETYTMVSACLEAFRTTRNDFWRTAARRVFQWFLGRNNLGLMVYDPITGGCRDSLRMDRVNQNEGAESSLAFYLSLAEMIDMENTIQSLKIPVTS